MPDITPQQLHTLLTLHPGLVVLDVRTPVEFDAVHVPQARNVPLDELQPRAFFESHPLIKAQPLYLLCQGGMAWTGVALP